MREHTTTRRASERNASEFFTGYSVEAVEFREAFVHERIVAAKKIEEAAVFAHHVLEEQFCFALHGFAQRRIEHGEELLVGLDVFERADFQPLAGEIVDERPRLR